MSSSTQPKASQKATSASFDSSSKIQTQANSGTKSTATSTTATPAAAATATPTSSTAANAVNGTTSTLASRAQGLSPGTTTSPYGTSTVGTAGMYGNSYGVGNSYSSPYGTTGYGGYGATGMYGNTSMYGNSSMYGSSPYGGYGGYGTSSMYGGSYGMNRIGGMYGNPYSMDPYGGGMQPQLAILQGMQNTMSSLGQMSQMLGTNADMMQHAALGFISFIENIGETAITVFKYTAGIPPSVPIDARTGQPMIDPRTGQPYIQQSPEEFAKERRKRLITVAVGLIVMLLGYKLSKIIYSQWFSTPANKSILEKEWSKMRLPARNISAPNTPIITFPIPDQTSLSITNARDMTPISSAPAYGNRNSLMKGTLL